MKTGFSLLSLLLCTVLAAQQKPLDHSVYDGWQLTSSVNLSDDGSILSYLVNPQEGDGMLCFRNLSDGNVLDVARGTAPYVSRDASWAFFSIKVPFADTRQAKIKKTKSDKMPKDTLAYVDLKDFTVRKLGPISKFSASIEKNVAVVYETGPKDSTLCVVFRPGTGRADTLRNVGSYRFDKEGGKLVAVFKKNRKDSLSRDEVRLFDLSDMSSTVLSEGKAFYSLPKFNEEGDKLVFLASADTNATGNKHCSVCFYETSAGMKPATEIVPADYSEGFPGNWCITENADPFFSRLSDRIFLGLSDYIPENDTTLVDFETAQLDIWNWDIYMTPPMQKARIESLRKNTSLAVINAGSGGKVVPLATSMLENVALLDGGEGDCAVITDREPYYISSTWDSNDLYDVYLVNLSDGTRETVFTALDGVPSVSPKGRFIVWYSGGDRNYHSYRISDGKVRNLTASVRGVFYDDEDDHPMPSPEIDSPHWLADDAGFLLADKYDMFRIDPDGGRAVNLTEGKGKKSGIQYRYVSMKRNTVSPILQEAGVRSVIDPEEVVFLTAFERSGKRNGYASVIPSKAGLLCSFVDEHSFLTPVKALHGDAIAYRKGDFRHSADVYVTKDAWRTEEKMSSINPQQDGYRWGDVRLVHWKAYDGRALDGLLYVPDGMEEGEKYPMMIYFYEKNSQTRYNYISPAPSRSTVNIPFYVSRRYVVFVPDIVYEVGHPGESAYNCICSGAEEMCRQFPFIDKDRMAIQGQSWGGYQTAYLVTRTDMFAAAGAGAPVGNMTSAYGGIRWESGMVRAMQYEHGQSRVGKSLWDEGGLGLYIENSPIFHTQNVTTPVLIMHNDNDGAVPWYQGIEFFMSLRRFGHPAWLLEYNNEAHNLVERRNCKDLSVRLQQFFDHYLKGDPMPAWMKSGVPQTRKGQYFGLELQ